MATWGAAGAVVVLSTCIGVTSKLVGLDEAMRMRTGSLGLFDLLGVDSIDRTKQSALENLRDDQTLVLVGDGNAYLYQRPTARLRYRTVFDVDAQSGESVIEAWAAPRASDEVMLVDPGELRRFSKTYWKIPALPRE